MAKKVNLKCVVEDYQHGLELKDKQHAALIKLIFKNRRVIC
jgi:hypothetical protein